MAWPAPVRRFVRALRALRYAGRGRECPCCGGRFRRFAPQGPARRPDARCPRCGSVERHRLIWLWFRERTDLFDGRPKRMLHVAPEPQLAALLRDLPGLDYLSADLSDPAAMERMDVADIRHPDDSFDIIYCSHVLEHVPDDRRAMRELCRVLRAGGWAVLQVPITAERTFEDPSATTDEERLRLFGQKDHVRRYGPDFRNRLEEAGFEVDVDGFVRELGAERIRRFGLNEAHDIFKCGKPTIGGG